MSSIYQKMYILSIIVKLDNSLPQELQIARRIRIPCSPAGRLYDVNRVVISGLATNRPELQKLITASGFGAHSIARHELAVIAASRAELTSSKAA
jgi:hypothetical protein